MKKAVFLMSKEFFGCLLILSYHYLFLKISCPKCHQTLLEYAFFCSTLKLKDATEVASAEFFAPYTDTVDTTLRTSACTVYCLGLCQMWVGCMTILELNHLSKRIQFMLSYTYT